MVVRHGSLRNPGLLFVIVHERPAWLTPDRKGWDALFTDDMVAWTRRATSGRSTPGRRRPNRARETSSEPGFVGRVRAERDKAWLKIARAVPLERSLQSTLSGTATSPILQVFVDFHPKDGPFNPGTSMWLEGVRAGERYGGHRPPTLPRATAFGSFPTRCRRRRTRHLRGLITGSICPLRASRSVGRAGTAR